MEPKRLPPALLAALGLAHGCDLGPCLRATVPCLTTSDTCETRGTCESGDTADTADTGATSAAPSTRDVRIEVLGSDRLPADVVRRLSTDR